MRFLRSGSICKLHRILCNLSTPNGKVHLRGNLLNVPATVKLLHTTSPVRDIFTIQDKDDFDSRVLQSDIPVVVDFQATWCGPCKTLGPRLEGIITTKHNMVHLAKVDIDDNTELAMEYGVTAVPAVFGINNGQVVDKFVGVLDDDQINSFVDKLVGPKD